MRILKTVIVVRGGAAYYLFENVSVLMEKITGRWDPALVRKERVEIDVSLS